MDHLATIAAVRAAIAADPSEQNNRLVLADLIDELRETDPTFPDLADGYRALAVLNRYPSVLPQTNDNSSFGYYFGDGGSVPRKAQDWERVDGLTEYELLPHDWYTVLQRLAGEAPLSVVFTTDGKPHHFYSHCAYTRKELEDTAALAFTELDPEYRRRLLAGETEWIVRDPRPKKLVPEPQT